MYEVRLSLDAEAYLRRLDRQTQQRMYRRLREIADDPHGPHAKRLAGVGSRYAARVGGWRIVFSINDAERAVVVGIIAPRGDVYRRL